ncbi:MAG: Trk system potassium transporter TrkA [Ruminococcaceae bacterium]|nr:Trk system potassium transporter TrkA [Oscillospiraceae bacterium]
MKIVIVGDGKVGFALADQLSKEGHAITVIDSNLDNLKNLMDVLDVLVVHGNGASLDVQREAGVDKSDLLIGATSSDELNILACLVAKKIGAGQTIARVKNPEYSEQLHFIKDELGLSMAVNPDLTAATEIARCLRFPNALNIDFFAKGRIELLEFTIPEGNMLDGMQLLSIYTTLKTRVLVCAVQRGDDVFIPDGHFTLRAGDNVTITSSPLEISLFFKTIGIYQQKIRTVLIVGGGNTSYYLAKQLCDLGMQVKIIESDLARCRTLSEMLPKAIILNGRGNDRELLQSENIEDADALIAASESDEMNLLISLYAQSVKVPKIITKIERTDVLEMYGNISSGIVVSPRQLIATNIIRFVRALSNSAGSSVETLHRIVNDRVEALEFRVNNAKDLVDRKLKDLPIRRGILVAVINRNGHVIIPGGNDVIMEGDSVIIVTTHKNLTDLTDILE